MNNPLITAIIPTYKRPQLLKRAVCSVLGQTFTNFEVLIADNASGHETDRVTSTLMRQDKRVKLLKHPTNMGMIANFQTALFQVNTPYVCFLCDDDFFAPFFFEETVSLFNHYPDIAFCGGGGLVIDQHYAVKTIRIFNQVLPTNGYYAPPKGLFAYLHSSFGIAFPSLLFKTTILHKLGGFDLRVRNGGDEHLISQCAARYPVYLITDRPFYFGFQHEGNTSSQIDYLLFEKEAACLYENLLSVPLASEEKEEIDAFFKKRQLKILSNAYRHYYNMREFGQAKAYADKLFHMTHSPKWKRKRMHAKVCQSLPLLATLYDSLKTAEQGLRSWGKQKQVPSKPTPTPPDANYWKEYALSLEKQAEELL